MVDSISSRKKKKTSTWVTYGGETIRLTPMESVIWEVLDLYRGHWVPKEELERYLWPDTPQKEGSTKLGVLLFYLRKKMPNSFENAQGRGWRIVPGKGSPRRLPTKKGVPVVPPKEAAGPSAFDGSFPGKVVSYLGLSYPLSGGELAVFQELLRVQGTWVTVDRLCRYTGGTRGEVDRAVRSMEAKRVPVMKAHGGRYLLRR
jgi:hypothetical protein